MDDSQSDAIRAKSRRCYHRVLSGIERGGRLRFLTLTSSVDSPDDIQKSWRALYMRLKRRNLVQGYIKVPEYTKEGRLHLHILFRGNFIEQALISRMWSQIHQAPVVDIRAVKMAGNKRKVANYMAKYMSKESAGRYSWSWGWVWKGFCKDWLSFKKYWWSWFNVEGKTTFKNCVTGWGMILHELIVVDWEALRFELPPGTVFQLNNWQGLPPAQLDFNIFEV